MSTTPQGQLKQGTELYSDSAKAQNQAVILNRSISLDLDIRVRSTHNITVLTLTIHKIGNTKNKNITNSYLRAKPQKWSFYSKTYIIIPTCTYDLAQPPIHPTLITNIFPSECTHSRCLDVRLAVTHRQSRYLSPHPPILARRRQAGEQGEDGRESSYVQVGMII